jgi:asparagine synthase (glutamine-hydrolysing)
VCGLGVWFDPRPSEEGVERTLRLHAPIRHRGPDDEGFLFVAADGTVARSSSGALPPGKRITLGMAFRRLGILDLRPEAAQPMGSADRATWLVFNGEIYNFRELRAELEAEGREFRSHGDTEVLLAAYERWGEGCFARLDGMWALAILDLPKRRLVVSRDRFGVKPLHWALCDGALLLASEAKQIVHAQGVRPTPNRPLVEMYLRGTRYPFVDETFFEGIHLMPPATWASWPLDDPPQTPVFHPYWALADHVAHPSRAVPYAEARDRVEETLTRAVASHMVADVEVGSCQRPRLAPVAL